MILFEQQVSAFDSLMETAEIFFEEDWHSLPVKPRFSRLITGPSGSGKTYIARCVAERLQIPYYSIDSTNWMPLGVNEKAAKPTWVDIASFLRRTERGLIIVDEVEKVGRSDSLTNSTWVQFIRVEMFTLFDRRLPENLSILEKDGETLAPDNFVAELELLQNRLSRGMMIIAAGAFQSIWQSRGKAPIGFHANGQLHDEEELMTHAHAAQILETEIVNRFASPILVMRPLGLKDYEKMLSKLVCKLPGKLAKDVQKIGSERLAAAAVAGLGVRWLEEIVFAALAKRRNTKTTRKSPIDDAFSQHLDLTSFVRDART